MAVDQYLELEGIKGESQDDVHKDQIDVLAWSFGMSQSGTFHVGSGSGAGKVNVQDLSVTKYVDKSSTVLWKHCCNGKHIPKATLYVRKAGETPVEYVVFELSPVMVTSISTGGSGGEDRLTENVTLNFKVMKTKYVPQKEDGSADAEVPFNWDVAANKEV